MEKKSRRGFLKTLGKLTAAVGLTAAVASTSGDTSGTAPKAKPLTNEELTWVKDGKKVMEFTVPKEYAKVDAGFTGFKKGGEMAPGSLIPIERVIPPAAQDHTDASRNMETNRLCQETMNEVYNAHVDNITMQMRPDMMVVPFAMYEDFHRQEAIRSLDPYNWGEVFELKWDDWRPQDPRHATVTGRWEAHVKPQFYGVFDGEQVYYQSQSIAMDYLAQRVKNADDVKKSAKDQCFRRLVASIQDVILERIKRNVQENGVAMRHISNRDTANLKGITD